MNEENNTTPSISMSNDDKTWSLFAHLSGLLFGFVGPLVIWIIKKDTNPIVGEHSKEALNFQLTLMIAYFVSCVLMIVLIGFLMILVLWVYSIIMMIIAAMKVNEGNDYKYPLTIRFIK